ncbi:MAG TPA: PPC domain-containing protein [Planctomycetaceae bacterium]|nr:PPC domain-containing protein [Planctomycetaceae bacterium]
MIRPTRLAPLAFLVAASTAAAGTSYPMVMSLRPVAIQAGTTAEMTVHSRYTMDGSYRILISGAGVTGQVEESSSQKAPALTAQTTPSVKSTTLKSNVAKKSASSDSSTVTRSKQSVAADRTSKKSVTSPKTLTVQKASTTKKPTAARATKKPRRPASDSLTVRFHADANALPGVRDFRVATVHGASTVGQLVVVADPVVAEIEGDNNSIEKAQAIPIPSAVCGAIDQGEDRDYYKFHVEAGKSLVFRVRGMLLEDRIHDLQNHLDPILTLRDPNGSTIAVADNDIAGDPLLCQRFERTGDYTLEIRDVRYKGDRDWVYCIEINDRPFVRTVFPLGVAAGRPASFAPVGYQIPVDRAFSWHVPANWPAGLHAMQLTLGSTPANPTEIVVSDVPVVKETSGAHATVKTAQQVETPTGINGRLLKEGESDVFTFRAKRGQPLSFEVYSRRAGSPLDSAIRILDARGRTLLEGDDSPEEGRLSADASIEGWSPPADGTYAIEIRDLLQRGGAEFVYFLKVTRAEPRFELTLDTDKTELSPNTSGVFFVNTVRRNGFAGDISLAVEGLPKGVTAFCSSIPAGQRDGCVILTASASAKPSIENIVVRGTATQKWTDGTLTTLAAVALPMQEIYLPGGGRGHMPVEAHAVAVGQLGDLRSIKLSTDSITLKPGSTARVDVVIERAPGFTDNVLLDPKFNHLGRIYGDTLPPGVDIDAKASKTLLNGTETHGYLTFRALPTAKPVEKRPVSVMANVSINFVMKATYSSQPLFVTTLPGK